MNPYPESFYTVRFSDCDPFRHLNNARYIDYFMNAREDHLREHYQLDLAEFYRKGLGWVVLQHEILYLRPVSHNETICIRSGLLDAGPEHLLVEMLMMDKQKKQLKALMHSRFVPVSLHTGRKEPHEHNFLEFLSDKIIPGLEGIIPAPRERVAYWQETLKTMQTV